MIRTSSIPGLNEVSEISPIDGDSSQPKVTWHYSLLGIHKSKECAQSSRLSGSNFSRSSSSPTLSPVQVSRRNPVQEKNRKLSIYLDSDRKASQNCVRLSIRGVGCRAPATVVEVPLTSSAKDAKVGKKERKRECMCVCACRVN